MLCRNRRAVARLRPVASATCDWVSVWRCWPKARMMAKLRSAACTTSGGGTSSAGMRTPLAEISILGAALHQVYHIILDEPDRHGKTWLTLPTFVPPVDTSGL